MRQHYWSVHFGLSSQRCRWKFIFGYLLYVPLHARVLCVLVSQWCCLFLFQWLKHYASLFLVFRFRPAYKAFRNDSSFNFMVFFFVYFFQAIYTVVQAIGFQQYGYCGFITAIAQFNGTGGGIVVGLLLLIVAFCFALTAAAHALMLTKIHEIYRSTGASMNKARAEFTTEFLRNQHVQEAASSAVSSAVNSQFNNSRY